MERLTIRRDHGITMADGYDFRIEPEDFDLVQEILARLAAYEDTGLEPEEVVPVIFCRECAKHDRCMKEKIFLSEGIAEPFCCMGVGKEVT